MTATSGTGEAAPVLRGRLADVAQHGNWSPRGWLDSWITCADGYTLSVIAGCATYCRPRPAYAAGRFLGSMFDVPHDYSGPYTHVEVIIDDAPLPAGWEQYDSAGVYGSVPVGVVQQLIDAHGGEVG